MKTVSVRLGFATNSSSAHSVISGGNDLTSLSDAEIAEVYRPSYGEDSFGWEETTWDDVDTIVNYAILLFLDYNQKQNDFSDELNTILKKYRSVKRSYDGIDHQSGYEVYGNPGTTEDKEEEFWNFVRNTSKIIGGNDNN